MQHLQRDRVAEVGQHEFLLPPTVQMRLPTVALQQRERCRVDHGDNEERIPMSREIRRRNASQSSIGSGRIREGRECLIGMNAKRLVSAGAKLAYGRLARYAGQDGNCYPAVVTLGAEIGVGSRQAQTVPHRGGESRIDSAPSPLL